MLMPSPVEGAWALAPSQAAAAPSTTPMPPRVMWTAQVAMQPVTPGAAASAGQPHSAMLRMPMSMPATTPVTLHGALPLHHDDDDDNMPQLPSFGSDYFGTALRTGHPSSFTMPGPADLGVPGLLRHTSANTDMLLQALDDPDEAITSRALPSDPFAMRGGEGGSTVEPSSHLAAPGTVKPERDSKRPRRS